MTCWLSPKSEYSTSAVPTFVLGSTALTTLNDVKSPLITGQPFLRRLHVVEGKIPKFKSIESPNTVVDAFGVMVFELIGDVNSTSVLAILPRFKMHGGFMQ